jgi:flavin reductase (DIM6/NTAB) family NADH-FMN oxidoreductase RutF
MVPSPTLLLLLSLLLGSTRVAIGFDVVDSPPLLNSPVYSLATRIPAAKDDASSSRTNMNLLTYATPVSIRPDRLWAIGLYRETLSWEVFQKEGKGILQLLTPEHIPLIRLLGGSSGRDVDKQEECCKLGWEWKEIKEEFPLVLPGCLSYVCLELQGDMIDGGTHDVAICKVTKMFTDSASTDPHLDTQTLRDRGLITEQGRIAETA